MESVHSPVGNPNWEVCSPPAGRPHSGVCTPQLRSPHGGLYIPEWGVHTGKCTLPQRGIRTRECALLHWEVPTVECTLPNEDFTLGSAHSLTWKSPLGNVYSSSLWGVPTGACAHPLWRVHTREPQWGNLIGECTFPHEEVPTKGVCTPPMESNHWRPQ